MIWTLSWLEVVNSKEEIDAFMAELPNPEYVGIQEESGKHEIMAKDTFEANNMEEAQDLVRDMYPELILPDGSLREFGCTSEAGEYFCQEDI